MRLVIKVNQSLSAHHRCAVHSKPMRFGRYRAALLSNFAELVMRVLEGAVLQKHPNSPVLDGYHCRGSAAYEQAYAIVDTSAPKWKILHANPAFNHLGGASAGSRRVNPRLPSFQLSALLSRGPR